MEPSHLSINPSQQSASQFFQKSAASLKSWGCRVCQQLHHHREILHTYSPKTKIGLLIAVNVLFFVVVRAFVNYWEERDNRTNLEKTLLNDKIATVLVGVMIAGLNVGLSKLGRYQLPALTLSAITLSSVAVYLILKRPRPLLAPIQEEIVNELQQINQRREELNQSRIELQRQASEISARLTNSPQTSPSTPTLPQPLASTPDLTQTTPPQDEAELQRVETQLTQIDQAQQSLSELEDTLRQEAGVIEEVLRTTPIPTNPSTPDRVNQLRRGLRNRLQRTLTQSPLVNTSHNGLDLPQSTPPNAPVPFSSPQVSRIMGGLTPPSSPSLSPLPLNANAASSQVFPASPTTLNSPAAPDDVHTPESETSSSTEPSDATTPPSVEQILRTPQTTTRWFVEGAINNLGPVLVQNAPNIASTVWNLFRRG